MIVGLGTGFVEVDGAAGHFVHPLDVALDEGWVERGFVEEDGLADGDGAEGPLDLEPGLRALFGIVVEEGSGLGPGVDLLLGAQCFWFAGGDEPLVHAGGDALLEVIVLTGDESFGGVDGAVSGAEVVWRDDHAAGGRGDGREVETGLE